MLSVLYLLLHAISVYVLCRYVSMYFPVFPTPDDIPTHPPDINVRIPAFCVDDCHNIFHIGSGTFGDVYRCKYEGQLHVMKKLSLTDDDDAKQHRLFLKEVTLLDRLRGHPNVVAVTGYCLPQHSLLMEYVSFSLTH